MSKHHRQDPNDPIQDFVDLQEHRYDPGYWPSQWATRRRYDPFYKALQNARLSAFYRALLMMLVVLPIEQMFFEEYGATGLKGVLIFGSMVLASFVILWFLIHLAMSRSARRASSVGRSERPGHT
jgi:hypothetical protein